MFDLPCPEVAVAVEVVREVSKQQGFRLDSGQKESGPNPKRRWIDYLRYLVPTNENGVKNLPLFHNLHDSPFTQFSPSTFFNLPLSI